MTGRPGANIAIAPVVSLSTSGCLPPDGDRDDYRQTRSEGTRPGTDSQARPPRRALSAGLRWSRDNYRYPPI
jgi:hypothetical protein